MARYAYLCSACGVESEAEHPIGTARRMVKCVCGRPARLLIGAGVQIGASCTPTKSGDVLAAKRRDRQFDLDGPAYKRMRHRGLQPEHIDGSAQLENKVECQADIDYARALKVAERNGGGGRERVLEAVASITPTHGSVDA